MHNVPGQPVILNYSTPTEKCSEFLDYHLKPLMQRGWGGVGEQSYIKDSGFIKKEMEFRLNPRECYFSYDGHGEFVSSHTA